jgi:hypothetical protein
MSLHFPSIYIILLNWNGYQDTIECLRSLQQVHHRGRCSILVVDNGSDNDSVQRLRTFDPTLAIEQSPHNIGFAAGNNLGIRHALYRKFDWVFLLNNDTVVKPDLLDALRAAIQQQPKARVLGAKIYRYHDPHRIDHLGAFWNPSIGEFESPAQGCLDDGVNFETMQPVDTVCGAAIAIHREVFLTIGFLEPRFFLFWEETDFCFRARRAGFPVWTAPQVRVWHKVSSSFTGGKPHMHYFWWRSRLLWIERNLSFQDKMKLYQKVIFREISKTFRHFLVRSCLHLLGDFAKRTISEQSRTKRRLDQAGVVGIFHHWIGRYGNGPKWLFTKTRSLR